VQLEPSFRTGKQLFKETLLSVLRPGVPQNQPGCGWCSLVRKWAQSLGLRSSSDIWVELGPACSAAAAPPPRHPLPRPTSPPAAKGPLDFLSVQPKQPDVCITDEHIVFEPGNERHTNFPCLPIPRRELLDNQPLISFSTPNPV
jgi:hypothetical protein